MWNILKRILIVAFFLAIITVGLVYFSLKSPRVWEWVVAKSLGRYGYQVNSIKIDKVNLRLSPDSYLQNIRLDLSKNDRPYKIECADLRFQFNRPKWKVDVFLSSLDLISTTFFINQVDSHVTLSTNSDGWLLTGPFTIKRFGLADYEWNNVAGNLVINDKIIEVASLESIFYDGKVEGKILLERTPEFPYSIDLTLKDINLEKLAQVNPGIFGQVKGIVSGSLKESGTKNKINFIKASFDAPLGGEMKASFFSQVLTYIPGNTKQYKTLEQLIKSDGMVPLNQFKMTVNSLDDTKISLNFDLESKKLNLKPNVTVDIIMDQGMMDFILGINEILSVIESFLAKGDKL